MAIESKKKFKLFWYALSFVPFLISHHPNCKEFKGHTLKVGKIRFCIGCFIGYPIAYFSVYIIYIINLTNFIPTFYFLVVAVVFISTIILSPLHLIKDTRIKIVQKSLIGIGSAFLFWWIYELPSPKSDNYLTIINVFTILVLLLNFYHVYGILRTCYKCEYSYNWGKCSGFQDVRFNFKRHNLPNILEGLEEFSNNIKMRKLKKHFREIKIQRL